MHERHTTDEKGECRDETCAEFECVEAVRNLKKMILMKPHKYESNDKNISG